MKTYSISKIGTAAIAAVLVLGTESGAHYRGNTSMSVQVARGVSAPASLAGRTLVLTGTGGGTRMIYFTQAGMGKFRLNGIFLVAEYSKSNARTKAEVALTAPHAETGWYIYMNFNQPQSGTYRLEELTCSDGSSPNIVVERGTFVIH